MCGLPGRATNFPSRRKHLRPDPTIQQSQSVRRDLIASLGLAFVLLASPAFGQGPVTVTLDDAIQMALQRNHSLLASRTTIQQSESEEITANLRPNPVFF